MSSAKKFYRLCDDCGTWTSVGFHNSNEALKDAKKRGWVRATRPSGVWIDLCPKCKPKDKKK